VQTPAKLLRQSIKNARNFFSNLAVIQWDNFESSG
jgi:hypothetical protein